MAQEPKRLLILSCSQRKCSAPGHLPAIERYDGPQFKVLRKFLHEHSEAALNLSVYILSANFGLIPATQSIPHYDYKMTVQRAHELRPVVLNNFKSILTDSFYNQLFINLGQNYLSALAGYEQFIPSYIKIITSQGSLGRRQAELHDWLHHNLQQQSSDQPAPPVLKPIRFRSVEINITLEQILDLTYERLIDDQDKATSYQYWYVQLNDQRISPKWLVSQLTGLPVSSFHTTDARRVLQQLGIEVSHI